MTCARVLYHTVLVFSNHVQLSTYVFSYDKIYNGVFFLLLSP